MERKRVEVERMLREEKEASTAATVNRARVLREEMARARKVGGLTEGGVGLAEILFRSQGP